MTLKETSALTGMNIHEVFQAVGLALLRQLG
jgi:hypothetical protein